VRIACVVPAKDEAAYIRATLLSIRQQSVRVDPIVVVDDGSEDQTAEISRGLGSLVKDGPRHSYQARMLRICETINAGLAELPPDLDYVMISGADDVFPANWCQELLTKMTLNPRLVIASGRIEGVGFNPFFPMGTRIIDYGWWRKEHDPPGIYRESYGWETLLPLFARYRGFQARQFRSPVSVAQRPVGALANWNERGKAMRDCGARLLQVAWRFQELARQGDMRAAASLAAGYLEGDVEPEPWAREFQANLLRHGVLRRLGVRRPAPGP
jgi:glycosyltransferase involved in cell wall biosynthesis